MLSKFYVANGGASFLAAARAGGKAHEAPAPAPPMAEAQEFNPYGPAGPAPPSGFKDYSKNAASHGVLGLMQQIISDAKAMETETLRDEEDAQRAYEGFVQETNREIEAKSKDITDKEAAKSQAEIDHVQAQADLDDVVLELEQLANVALQLKQSCDFTIRNFDLRQAARDEEIEALQQAKAILSGADFQAAVEAS